MDWSQLITEAKENGYSNVILPTDDYEAVVKKAEFKQQSGKKDRLQVKWEILSGAYKGETVMEFISIDLNNDKLMGVILSKLTGAGITGEFLTAQSGKFGALNEQNKADHFKAIAGQLHGNKAVINVKATEYQGKPKNEVFAQYPLTDQTAVAPTPEQPPVANPYSAPVNPQMPI